MRKLITKSMSVLMVMLMVAVYIIPSASASSLTASEIQSCDDGVTNYDFIKPVTHQTTVPEGYIGVYTPSDLDNVRNNLTANYIIMNNIDLAEWGNWTPVGEAETPFSGVFDGNGYTISNMAINITSENDVCAGLFGLANNAELINIGLIDALISVTSLKSVFVSGLAGSVTSSTITNCFNGGESNSIEVLSAGSCNAGGISTGFSKAITDCYNTSLISINAQNACVGGIDSYSVSNIICCYNTGLIVVGVEETAYVGGICGYSSFKISNCYNLGNLYVNAYKVYMGGIAGYSSRISTSYNIGKIVPIENVQIIYLGGISGYNAFHHTVGGTTPISDFFANIFSSLPQPFVGLIQCCYCLNDISSVTIGNAEDSVLSMWSVKALSDEEMYEKQSFRGFDFRNVWSLPDNGGYPVFRQNPKQDTSLWDILISYIFGWM